MSDIAKAMADVQRAKHFEFCKLSVNDSTITVKFKGNVVAAICCVRLGFPASHRWWEISAKVGGIPLGSHEFKSKRAAITWIFEHAEKLDAIEGKL